METIFTLLIIILPIVFKLIGKKLEQAGQQSGKQEPIEDWTQVLKRHLEMPQASHKVPAPEVSDRPASGNTFYFPTDSHAAQIVKTTTKPTLKEETKKKGEKIDKKKLIVYSEIMKPKYNE